MPHFLQNRAQRFLFSRHFALQKFLPPPDLLLEHAWPRLPRKRNPRQKRRPVPLCRPIFALQSIRQRCPPRCRGFKAASLRTRRVLTGLQRTNHPHPSQLFQRVVHLRPRNPRPIPYLATLQLRIRLISMHRPLRQQAKQDQVWRRQCQFRTSVFLQSLRAPLRFSVPLRYLLLFSFVTSTSVLRCFLLLLHHHHWHFSAASRGFFACATAAQNVSSTQGSSRCPVARSIFSYIRCGFCLASSATLRIPSNSKSRSIAGPIEISSPSSRVLATIKTSLTAELYSVILT